LSSRKEGRDNKRREAAKEQNRAPDLYYLLLRFCKLSKGGNNFALFFSRRFYCVCEWWRSSSCAGI